MWRGTGKRRVMKAANELARKAVVGVESVCLLVVGALPPRGPP